MPTTHPSTPLAPAVPRLPGRLRRERLDNGLTVCLLDNPQAPLVTVALWYRAGTRDEPAGHGGVAHFLEHMMFKGSAAYGPGEIDRRTQELGGVNNAFTSHDATAYYFNFARDRWREALGLEADRMAGLTLAPEAVASERQVILEEIAMYHSEPWEALDLAVQARLYGGHAYGRPVLGTPEELAATGPRELADFHHRFYRPDNAVLVVAGELEAATLDAVAERFGPLPPGAGRRPPSSSPSYPRGLERYEQRMGEVPRLLAMLPAPPADHPDSPALQLAATLTGGGRTSRLWRALVDEGQLAAWVTAQTSETLEPGALAIAAELPAGTEPARVEAELLAQLAELRRHPPGAEELERARRITLADWVFQHERIHQQALAVGFATALFSPDYLERQLERLAEVGPEEIHQAARRYLDPDSGAVFGWSLPKGER